MVAVLAVTTLNTPASVRAPVAVPAPNVACKVMTLALYAYVQATRATSAPRRVLAAAAAVLLVPTAIQPTVAGREVDLQRQSAIRANPTSTIRLFFSTVCLRLPSASNTSTL